MDEFKPIELTDKGVISGFFAADPPQVSELTFTNLFMWRHRYAPLWRVWKDMLLMVLRPDDSGPYGLPPVGMKRKGEALDLLCADLARQHLEPRVCRADRDFVERYVDQDRYLALEDRDNSDYVYLTGNLIDLPGRKYHGKKNHLNKFIKNNQFQYRELDEELVELCLNLQEEWCQLRECTLNPGLLQENLAISEALKHHRNLGFAGGAILIDSKVQAFALGEELNPDTAVIHIEKANPDIPGLYAAINQQFCAHAWSHLKYVNREQDLGLEGLRKAKLSYNPEKIVEKFTLVPKN